MAKPSPQRRKRFGLRFWTISAVLGLARTHMLVPQFLLTGAERNTSLDLRAAPIMLH
jgi:hypothetical protein